MAYSNIKKPSEYFNTVLYSGDGTSNRSITGVNFQPDLVWIKNRNSTNNHQWVDSVRGLFRLGSDSSVAEASVSGAFNSFDSDGFNVTEEANWEFNNSGKTYAAWNWLGANGTSANTDGSISSTVSANTTSGFSIGTYTGNGTAGATIGHGLASDKVTIIVKRTDTTGNWGVKHYKIPATQWLQLDQTDGANTSSVIWNDTEPTSSVFSVGSYVGTNASGGTYVFYAFAEKQGFSKFGSYTGNGSTDGTFIYTGFKPAWVIIKNTSVSNDWFMIDNSRDTLAPNNPVGRKSLFANTSGAEVTRTTKDMDFLSNGIKLRTADGTQNNSGENYIYMAFASEPLVGDNPATAR